ncbi:MAG: hypothetical protein NUV50_04375 [Rhodospirillales bacterium]|nr:hypothetical protein [Rhodospirillales bacterium]
MGWPDSLPLSSAVDRTSIQDGRARFRALLHAVNAAHGRALPDYRPTDQILRDLGGEGEASEHAPFLGPLPAQVRVIAVPGFMTECVASLCDVLPDAMAHLQSLGAQTLIAPLAGRGGAAFNARQLRDILLSLPEGETVILIAMSKGAVDTQEMLALYPETHVRVAAVVSLVGAVCGSPLAHLAPAWLKWIERHILLPHCRTHGGAAVHSLTPEVRRTFLGCHEPVAGVRYYSLGAAVEAQAMSKGMMSAYQALCRIHALNDGQMMLADQILPGAEVLGVLNGDHIAVGMPFNRNTGLLGRWVAKHLLDKNAFPREVLVEAVVRRVLEDLPNLSV